MFCSICQFTVFYKLPYSHCLYWAYKFVARNLFAIFRRQLKNIYIIIRIAGHSQGRVAQNLKLRKCRAQEIKAGFEAKCRVQ